MSNSNREALVQSKPNRSQQNKCRDKIPTEYPDLDASLKPLGTSSNLKVVLSNANLEIAVNSMNTEIELFENGILVDKSQDHKRSRLLDECYKAGFKKTLIDDHLIALAESNKYHPFADYLKGDSWDGIGRIDQLIEAMNAKNRPLAHSVMKKFFIAVVAAVYQPNFSSKLIPVIQGDQSFRKTAFIRRFANMLDGAFLEGQELNPDQKDSVLSCIKSMIVELGELERTSRNSQGGLKAFFTKSIDSVRPPYGQKDIKKPRQTLFIATVNGTDFFRDETGSSRYAVIELAERVDMDRVNDILGWDYDNGRLTLIEPYRLKQFWLEAYQLYKAGESWELSEDELAMAAEANKSHDFKSSYYEILRDKFIDVDMDNRSFENMTATAVCEYANIPTSNVRAVGKALKRLVTEGLLESKPGRSNKTLYKMPTISCFS